MADAPLNSSKTVYYINRVAHPVFLETVGAEPDIELHGFTSDSPEGEIGPVMAAAHAYQIDSTRANIPEKYWGSEALLTRSPNLLLLSTNGAGYDTIDVDACTRAGVLVVNQSGANREAVAEHALGLILTASKRITETDRVMRRGEKVNREGFIGDEVAGKTLGVIGIGNTGSTLTKMAVAALSMPVLAYDPFVDAETIASYGATKVEFDELLSRADYVSVHCPRTELSANMFDAAAFAKMKAGAYFISTARGGIHDEAALYEALVGGQIKAAGLDVWDPEPPEPDHPLLSLDNVIASPHTAGLTFTARERLGQWAAEQMIDVLNGKRPPRLINPDAWALFEERYEKLLGPGVDAAE
ncbi:MAG: 3-phosphoglycerate dehydrogenase [Alphaproteobacteria bacterium]|nr:3-phosphoglycerate dehydrogenase [Alphaproteobacteria bacterium]